LDAVQGLNRFLRFLLIAHGDEAEAAGFVGSAVHQEVGLQHRAMGGKSVLEVVLGGVEGNVSDKQFIIHRYRSGKRQEYSRLSPNAGPEIITDSSSLEELPCLEKTSYLTDFPSVGCIGGIATTIGKYISGCLRRLQGACGI
jgi:hypothetical protein